VPLSESQRSILFSELLARGWHWRGNFIYATNATMWLLGSEPWVGSLQEFHERMCGRLQRNKQLGWAYAEVIEHQNLVKDTQGLVEALANMLPKCVA
jgi:hypothetical protein